MSNATTPAVQEIDILWLTAGLGCDGDTIAMTAATQPSIEEIVTRRAALDPQSPLLQPISLHRKRRRIRPPLPRSG